MEISGKQVKHLFDKKTVSIVNNSNKNCYHVWPGGNNLLCKGLTSIISSLPDHFNNQDPADIVFIDISVQNFHAIIMEEWIQAFNGCKLILICDNKLSPLAHYWFLRMRTLGVIGGVIYPHDNINEIIRKITIIISGQPIIIDNITPKISLKEYSILQLLYLGANAKRIASLCNSTVKTIYAHKSSIERKISIPINRIPR
ncbi:helix-turn-helix transcriptional regulator [Citrobacter telavivensis]|uniref:helix-turn-helix transcriptional regulator n=1 Tax=Citrobacter telavivensis TaxID=2653932 RepID=UPI00359EFDDB